METTFITVHDLSIDARILYASDSITDILGYPPREAIGKACWEYFHPEEIPFAQAVHGRGVELDKAAVLSYCQIKHADGYWVGCECVFTVAYDVLVACTSVYRAGMKSQKRALDAPKIRRIFSSSPKDPRYHMLSHLSSKFSSEPKAPRHEPRATLFLNRFTRTMTIMYASEAVARILGISAEEMTEKSFYYCIQENCLPEAIRCLESAKANDSIAYLRFWFRDPRQDEHRDDESLDDANSRLGSSSEEEDGGVELERQDERPTNYQQSAIRPTVEGYRDSETSQGDSSTARTSGNSTDIEGSATNSVFDGLETSRSSTSSLPQLNSPTSQDRSRQDQTPEQVPERNESIELEAVVSCTSDGMVVILRRARPVAPEVLQDSAQPVYANGLFASPWAQEPILPLAQQGMAVARDGRMVPRLVPAAPYPQAGGYAAFPPGHAGPPMDQFMNSIREVAVFAWALTGINGCLETYGRGKPMGESQPPDGFPVWAPDVHEGNVTGAGQASSNRQFPPPPS